MTVERTALAADPRIAGVEQAVYADSSEQVAIASSTGVAGEYETSSCFAYLQALAEGDGARETGLGFGLARGPEGLDPEAIGAEGAERALAMIGAGKPELALLPGRLRPDRGRQLRRPDRRRASASAVQRGRSPFAGRLGEEVGQPGAGPATTTAATPRAPARPRSTARACRAARTALIEGGRLHAYLYDTYTANREGGASTGYAPPAAATARCPRSRPRTWSSRAGELSLAELLAEAGEGVYVTDVAGLHSGVNPVTGVFSVGASGRAIRGGELAEPVREVHDCAAIWSPC